MTSPQCNLSLNDIVIDKVRRDYAMCSTPSGAYATASCVDGLSNEPEACGFADNKQELCNYCHMQTNLTDSCCDDIRPDVCEGISPRLGPRVFDVGNNATSAPPSELPDAPGGISHGLVALIVVCTVLGFSGFLWALLLACWKWRKAASVRDRMRTLNLPRPRDRPSLLRESEAVPSSMVQVLSAYSSSEFPYKHKLMDNSLTQTSFESSKTQTPDSKRTIATTTETIQSRCSSSRNTRSIEASASFDSFGGKQSFVDQYSGRVVNVRDIVRCIHDYDPILPDELEARVGDFIRVCEIYDDSWCKGFVLDSASQQPRAFPSVCVSAQSFTSTHGSAVSWLTGQAQEISKNVEEPVETVQDEEGAIPSRASLSRFREHVDLGTT